MQGVAINFVREDDVRVLRDIEQYYSTQIDEMVRPSSHNIVCSHTPQDLDNHELASRSMRPSLSCLHSKIPHVMVSWQILGMGTTFPKCRLLARVS